MEHKYKLLFIISLLLFSLPAFGQTDTVFWFAAPEVEGPNFQDRPIVMRLTTYAQAATVTISQPAGGGMPTQTINVAANSTQAVDLSQWITSIQNTPGNSVLNYGLKIKATVPITAYYDVVSNIGGCYCNPEIFTLKGNNSLGTDFWIPGQDFADNHTGYAPFTANSFDIVATQDNTTVTITPSHDIVGHTAGSTFTIVLNTGQTYSASGTSQLAAQHLMGSRVTSNKPIAITVKDDILDGLHWGCAVCADLAGDQIVPTSNVGTEYIAIRGELPVPYDKIFITAIQNGTTISQNGTFLTTINAGQTYMLGMIGATDTATYIQTSNPAYAYQLTGVGGELGTALLPAISCNGSTSVSFTNSSDGFLYVNVLVKHGGEGSFLVNGAAGVIKAVHFRPVRGTNTQWYAAHIPLSSTQFPLGTVISVTNSAPFQLSMLNGKGGQGANYGYFSDYGASKIITANTTTASICEGAYISLYMDTLLPNITWTGPNGFTSNSPAPIINNATVADSGVYYLNLTGANCTRGDTVLIQVHAAPKINIKADNDTICKGAKVMLTATGADTYTWTFTEALSDTTSAGLQIQPDTTTAYYVTGTDANTCVNKDSIAITVKPYSLPPVVSDTLYCRGDNATALTARGQNLLWYTDSTGGTGTPIAPMPVTENIGTTAFYVSQSLYNKNTGFYDCESKRSLAKIIVHDNPVVSIIANKSSLCEGDSLLLAVKNVDLSNHYQWMPLGVVSNITDTTTWIYSALPGYVYLIATDTSKCVGKDTFYIDAQPCCVVSFPTAFTPNSDGKNDVFRAITAGHHQMNDFMVVNRWGKTVFETKDGNGSWDGTLNGIPQDIGVYYYYVEYECKGNQIKEKGSVTLIR